MDVWSKAFLQARKQNDFDHEYDPVTGKRKMDDVRKADIPSKVQEKENIEGIDSNEEEMEEFGAFKQPTSLARFIHNHSNESAVDIPQKIDDHDDIVIPTHLYRVSRKRRRLNITLSYQL